MLLNVFLFFLYNTFNFSHSKIIIFFYIQKILCDLLKINSYPILSLFRETITLFLMSQDHNKNYYKNLYNFFFIYITNYFYLSLSPLENSTFISLKVYFIISKYILHPYLINYSKMNSFFIN